jgi:hypothetical protein
MVKKRNAHRVFVGKLLGKTVSWKAKKMGGSRCMSYTSQSVL